MLALRRGTRVYQSKQNRIGGTWTFANTQTGTTLQMDATSRDLLERVLTTRSAYKARNVAVFPRTRALLRVLDAHRFLAAPNEPTAKTAFLKPCTADFPLSSLAIELTNACNLRCRHCYGQYGQPKQNHFIRLDDIASLLPDLDRLHTSKVALTGGEALLHPELKRILTMFLERGIDVVLFTNGYEPERLQDLLQATRDFRFSVKISLDGHAPQHNALRGRKSSHERALRSLNILATFANIDGTISTVVTRENRHIIPAFREWVAATYPTMSHGMDLETPFSAVTRPSFTAKDFPGLYEEFPGVFPQQNSGTPRSPEHRCSAGVTQATLDATGRLRICNAAVDEEFYFSRNVFETSLEEAWCDPGMSVSRIRAERARSTPQCQSCKIAKVCTATDCRLIAKAYGRTPAEASPLTCFSSHQALCVEHETTGA